MVSAGLYTIPANYKDRFILLLAELHDANNKLISRSYYYPRSLVKMEDKAFYDKYVNEPTPWITLNNGPWLKPTVAKNATTLSIQETSNTIVSEGESEVKLLVKNTGKVPAFMAKVDVAGVKRAFYASDNFFWLSPGESKTITMNVLWREKDNQPVFTAAAWNAPQVEIKSKN